MMLRGDEQFPVVAITTFKKRLRVPDEVPQNMFFQMGLGMRRIAPAELIEAGKQSAFIIGHSAINRVVPAASAGWIRLGRSSSIDQFAQTADLHFLEEAHAL